DYTELVEKIRGSFKGFFSKKIKTEQMIMKIEEEKESLRKSLQRLDEKTRSLEFMKSSKELRDQADAIGKELKDYEANRTGLMRKIDELISYIRT
ncbi:MAG: hypothetical protein ACP5N3_05215, partial [Candidatus Nanoarchaeia archaeon]